MFTDTMRYETNQFLVENPDSDLLDFLHDDPDLIVEPFLQGKHFKFITSDNSNEAT